MAVNGHTGAQALRHAATVALAAPSIFNTQPWRWQHSPGELRLWADRDRQLMVADPQARLLTISCGVALHHARVALAAAGHEVTVRRLPDPDDADLLAVLAVGGEHEPALQKKRLEAAISRRRTDRRAFGPEPIAEALAYRMVDAAQEQGAHLHLIRRGQVSELATVAAQASRLQLADAGYRRELIRWTHRPSWAGDGVPLATAVTGSPRAVPVRDFAPFGDPASSPGGETDRGARYALFFTDTDDQLAWLRCGEALSAVLLTATADGLGTAPVSDVTELAVTRERLRHMLSGIGVPQLVVRVGYPPAGRPAAAPRRDCGAAIYP